MAEQPWVSTSTPYVQHRRQGQADPWEGEAAREGRVGTHQLAEVGEVVAPDDVAERLGVPAGSRVVVRRRVVLLDGQPVELADSYYPLAIAAGTRLAERRKIRGGAVTLLAELGHPPRRAEEDVSARSGTAEERQALRLGEHDWVLVLARTLKAEDGTPVEVTVMKMIAQGRHLRYDTTL